MRVRGSYSRLASASGGTTGKSTASSSSLATSVVDPGLGAARRQPGCSRAGVSHAPALRLLLDEIEHPVDEDVSAVADAEGPVAAKPRTGALVRRRDARDFPQERLLIPKPARTECKDGLREPGLGEVFERRGVDLPRTGSLAARTSPYQPERDLLLRTLPPTGPSHPRSSAAWWCREGSGAPARPAAAPRAAAARRDRAGSARLPSSATSGRCRPTSTRSVSISARQVVAVSAATTVPISSGKVKVRKKLLNKHDVRRYPAAAAGSRDAIATLNCEPAVEPSAAAAGRSCRYRSASPSRRSCVDRPAHHVRAAISQ